MLRIVQMIRHRYVCLSFEQPLTSTLDRQKCTQTVPTLKIQCKKFSPFDIKMLV